MSTLCRLVRRDGRHNPWTDVLFTLVPRSSNSPLGMSGRKREFVGGLASISCQANDIGPALRWLGSGRSSRPSCRHEQPMINNGHLEATDQWNCAAKRRTGGQLQLELRQEPFRTATEGQASSPPLLLRCLDGDRHQRQDPGGRTSGRERPGFVRPGLCGTVRDLSRSCRSLRGEGRHPPSMFSKPPRSPLAVPLCVSRPARSCEPRPAQVTILSSAPDVGEFSDSITRGSGYGPGR